MAIKEVNDDAQSSLIKPSNTDKTKSLPIRNSTFHLNDKLQRMYADGYYEAYTDNEKFHQCVKYDKFDQSKHRQRHFWSWQLIFTLIIIVVIINVLILLSIIICQLNNKMQTFDRFLPLNDFRKRTLATSKLRKSLLSIDTNNNLLILSSLDNRTDQLFVEQLALDDFQNGLTPKNIKLAGNMKNCQQLSSFVHCCVITAADNDSSADKGTHCFRQKITEFPDHFYEKNTQMIHTWQTFSNDETVVLLQNVAGDYSILDTKYGFSMPISENEDYVNLTPVAYFFGMDNAKELTELAQDDYKFYICEYLRDSEHRFLLQECYETAFRKMEKFSAVKFCANPIYQAVIQISEKMSTNLKWQLQVTYTATNDVIDDNVYTVDSTDLISNEQIAMICLPFSIDIYIVSNSVLVHYAVDLPKADGEALIGNYF